MKKLTLYANCLLAALILEVIIFTGIIISQPLKWELFAGPLLAAALITALFLITAFKNIKTAQLIIENQIMYVMPMVFQMQKNGKTSELFARDFVEVFVSCFGILLDSKIIRFNQNGIRLKKVELGRDFILLTYGTNLKTQTSRILHSETENSVLLKIAEKFRYETGIIPSIID
ncbi:MAG: hypothetical protein VB120_06170 [Lachnospiraceae bacterium]|nr:hypothetical protein [Lachnospiraceae bacterium]